MSLPYGENPCYKYILVRILVSKVLLNKLQALVCEQTIPTKWLLLVSEIMPTFVDRGCRVVSAMDPHGRIFGFLDHSCYYFFQVAPQLYSRSWVDPVPDPLLLRKSSSAGNRIWDLGICSQEPWPLDHRGDQVLLSIIDNVPLSIKFRDWFNISS
jgi:hypothetical protein